MTAIPASVDLLDGTKNVAGQTVMAVWTTLRLLHENEAQRDVLLDALVCAEGGAVPGGVGRLVQWGLMRAEDAGMHRDTAAVIRSAVSFDDETMMIKLRSPVASG